MFTPSPVSSGSPRLLMSATVALVLGGCAASSPRAVPLPERTTPQPSGLAALPRVDSGAFVVTLGADTIALERYTKSADRLQGELVLRSPRTRVIRYDADLSPSGEFRDLRLTTGMLRPDGSLEQQQTATVSVQGDSAMSEVPGRDGRRTIRMRAPGVIVPFLNNSFAWSEYAIGRLRARGADSLHVSLVPIGGQQPMSSWVARGRGDTVRIAFFGSPIAMRVDEAGRVRSADASATTVRVSAQRVSGADHDRLARDFAARDEAGRGLGQLSPRDSVVATVGGARITVDYSRPSRRGRVIFGNIVPWNQVWRTGANQATHFTTDRDLVIGGTPVPAGRYTLFTLPTREGATLIISRSVDISGTAYDSSADLARIPMTVRSLPEDVEQLTIRIDSAEDGGTLRIQWERTEWAVPFEVR